MLREIVNYVFDKLGIDRDRIKTNPAFMRPTEIEDIYGSNKKARTVLNWQYNMDFFEVLNLIIEEEYKSYGK
jgi:GDPmannose 4,6-dehydratase